MSAMSRWLWLPLLASLAVGCVKSSEGVRSTSWLQPFRPATGPAGADVVHMDVALVELPVGDRFLNKDLWTLADEQVIALDRKAVLEDNGLKVGQLGVAPARLQRLLTSDRTCINPRRIALRSGNSYELMLGPPHAQLRFAVEKAGETREVVCDEAQCVLVVTPTLTPDGRTLLRCTPEVRHGQVQHLPRPADDLSGWVLQARQATERYADWTFEVPLATNEYVAVGGRLDRPTSFGNRCFVRCDREPPVQRLLVIRTGRVAPSVASAASSASEDEKPRESVVPPIAVQAALAGRGDNKR
jgi:hypothetical protein